MVSPERSSPSRPERSRRSERSRQRILDAAGEKFASVGFAKATVEDIARAALWLASDDSNWVTGHAQVVDGGAFAGRPWSRQPDWITGDRPIKLYRPEGR